MLKTTGSSKGTALKTFIAGNNEVSDGDGRANKTIRNLSRKSTYIPNIGAIGESNILTPNAKKSFIYLQLAFIKASIFQHFDLKSHIQIKTNV